MISICVQTGIQTKIDCEKLCCSSLPFIHPLSYEENIRQVFGKLARQGILPEKELDANVLAGCLIGFLQSQNLLLVKNPIDANRYLSKASTQKLSYILRWFLARRSFYDFPKLSLLDLHLNHDWFKPTKQKSYPDAEIVLENYLKACQGEKGNYQYVANVQPKKVKVFTDKVRQEQKQVMEAKEEANYLVAQIEKEFGGLDLTKPILTRLKTAVSALSFLSDENKQKIAFELTSTFSGFEPAAELAMIFRKTSNEALHEDMGTFTQSYDNKKITKVSFTKKD